MSGRVVHFEIPYDDGDRARSFYGEVFGWDLQDWGGGEYTLVTTGPTGESGSTEPGFINGGMMRRQPPIGDMGWSAYFTDPEGNLLGLFQSA